MAVEKKWLTVLATPFTADGTRFGVVTIADTAGFKVKGAAYLVANTLPPLELQIQRVLSPTQLIVGPPRTIPNPAIFTDISAYTVALNAQIGFAEQVKNPIRPDDIIQATYEADPTVAWRTVDVDQYGNFYTADNPLPVAFDGTISIGQVEVKGTNGNFIEPNADGSLNVNIVETPVTGQNVVSRYNEIMSVASGVQTQILSYTVPAGKTAVLQRINTSGDNVGRYDVYLNGASFDTQRTYFGGSFDALFEYTTGTNNGLVLNAGDIISIKILHNSVFVGSFTARLQVLEIT